MPSVLDRHEGHPVKYRKTQAIHKMEQQFSFAGFNPLMKTQDGRERFVCQLLKTVFPVVSLEVTARDKPPGSEVHVDKD